MLLRSVQIGCPPVESPTTDRMKARHPRDVGLEVSRRHEQSTLQSRAHGGDELFADVRDCDIGGWKRVDARIRVPEVELEAVRSRVCPSRLDRVLIAVDPDHGTKAELRRRD